MTRASHASARRSASSRSTDAGAPTGTRSGIARSPILQTQLAVGRPNDRFEEEAERVASLVVHAPAWAPAPPISPLAPDRVQRVCKECDEEREKEDEEPLLQRCGCGASCSCGARQAPPEALEALRGPAQALDPASRALLEPRLGHDFSSVRIHADGTAARSARSVGARAFTVGSDIVFGSGQHAPSTEDGLRLLAHELTHVVQQGAAAPKSASPVRERDPEHNLRRAPEERETPEAASGTGEAEATPPVPAAPGGTAEAEGGDAGVDAAPAVPAGPTCAAAAGAGNRQFLPPTFVRENPIKRLEAGKPGSGHTFLKLNGTVVNPAATMTLGQLVQSYEALITPPNVLATPAAKGVSCCFSNTFKVNPSAKVIVTTNPGSTGWTANVTPNNFLKPADQPTCAGKSNVPTTFEGKPSHTDYAKTVRDSELEHVAALEELHQRHFVPYYNFVAGLTATATDAAQCETALRGQVGDRTNQAATGFAIGDMAETQRLDDKTVGSHFANLTPNIATGCASITISAQPRAKVPGTSRGNVATIAPTSTAIATATLATSGNDLTDGTNVIASFTSPARAARALAVFQHYGIDESLSIGSFRYFLAGGAPPSGALAGTVERNLDPAFYQVGVDLTPAGGWVIVETVGQQTNLIHEFGGNRDEAFSAVDQMRAHGFNREAWIPSSASPELRYFRRD